MSDDSPRSIGRGILLRRLAAVSSGAYAAAALALTRSTAGAQTASTVRVGVVMSDDVTPIYYAFQTGMFKKVGIDVELTVLPSGGAITAAVIGGSLDAGHSSLIPLLAAHARGIPVVLISPGAVYNPNAPLAELAQPADGDLKTGKDLDGKTVAVSALGDLTTLVVSAWVDQNGGDSKTLRFVEMPIPAQPAALAEHRIDAALLINPALEETLMTGKVKRLAPVMSAIGSSYMLSSDFAMNEWATGHRQLVKTFGHVVSASVAFTNAHHDLTATMMSEATKIPLPVFSKMARADSFTALDPARIQPVIDFAARYKMIPSSFPAREIIF